MQDLRPASVFKMSAFIPSEEEVRAACRAATSRGRARSPPAKKAKIEFVNFDLDLDSSDDSDSDDDMPDLSVLLRSSPQDKAGKSKPKPKAGAKKAKVTGKGKKRVESDSDSDVDMDGSDSESDSSDSDAPKRKNKGGKPKSKGSKGKAKSSPKDTDRDEPKAPSAMDPRQFEMWKQGGSNVESSAKMVQMIAYLKEWESTGDKTIVFSQCEYRLLMLCSCAVSDSRVWCVCDIKGRRCSTCASRCLRAMGSGACAMMGRWTERRASTV